jgi:transcriptional regulator with XRE-family HTH domain
MKNLKVIVEKTSTGYSAFAEKHSVFTTGNTIKELTENIIEALNFYFEESGSSMNAARKNIDFTFSIPSLFELYPINTRQFASRIGMNYTLLSQYVQGRKKPSEKQIDRIVDGLNEVGKELSEMRIGLTARKMTGQ